MFNQSTNDLNVVNIAGRVWGQISRNTTANGMVLSFHLIVSKMLRNGDHKTSRFKVVLFDDLASRWEESIFADARLVIGGELDETTWDQPNGMSPGREVRVVGRFVQLIGSAS